QSISAVERDIRERMAHHEAALQSSAGLFRSSASVTRGEWDEFQKMFRDENRFLGTSNVVFALAVPRSELDEHIYDMKRQGFSNYRVYPETSQDLIAPVIYPVSTVTKKNYQEVKPFGFNILSDPKRLQAANQAVEQKRAILSDRITLIRDDGDTAPAFTMILPVYRQANRDGEVDESNIYGFVYVPLMAETMFNEIFASNNTVNIGMQVYDGDVSPDNLIYENDSFNEPGVGDMITRDLQVNNHQWQIVYKPLESAISQNIRRGP